MVTEEQLLAAGYRPFPANEVTRPHATRGFGKWWRNELHTAKLFYLIFWEYPPMPLPGLEMNRYYPTARLYLKGSDGSGIDIAVHEPWELAHHEAWYYAFWLSCCIPDMHNQP